MADDTGSSATADTQTHNQRRAAAIAAARARQPGAEAPSGMSFGDFESVSDDMGSVGTADRRPQQLPPQRGAAPQRRAPGAEAPSGMSGFGGAAPPHALSESLCKLPTQLDYSFALTVCLCPPASPDFESVSDDMGSVGTGAQGRTPPRAPMQQRRTPGAEAPSGMSGFGGAGPAKRRSLSLSVSHPLCE